MLHRPCKLIVKLIVRWQKAMPNMVLSAITHHDTYVYRKIVEISLTPNSKLKIYRLRLDVFHNFIQCGRNVFRLGMNDNGEDIKERRKKIQKVIF